MSRMWFLMKSYWMKILIKSSEALFNLTRQLFKTCSSRTFMVFQLILSIKSQIFLSTRYQTLLIFNVVWVLFQPFVVFFMVLKDDDITQLVHVCICLIILAYAKSQINLYNQNTIEFDWTHIFCKSLFHFIIYI